jgi:hypothetical protein
MPRRTRSQIIGESGQEFVRNLIGMSNDWIVRGQEKDYGIDLEAELGRPEVRGKFLKIQIRTSKSLRVRHGFVHVQIERKLLRYADECRVPVILVCVDIRNERAFYIWVQEWLQKEWDSIDIDSDSPRTVAIKIPTSQDLRGGLVRRLKDIAVGETPTNVVLNIRSLIRSVVLLGYEKVPAAFARFLAEIKESPNFPVAVLVQEVISLRNILRGTIPYLSTSTVLYAFCKEFGQSFSPDHIRKLVLRGDRYSRAGINALGFLYENYPQHIESMNLPRQFALEGHQPPAYYCKLREKYLGMPSIELIVGICKGEIDSYIDGLDIDPSTRDELLDDWANRGDSAILDHLVGFARGRTDD